MDKLEYWKFEEKEPPLNTLIIWAEDDAHYWHFGCYTWSDSYQCNVLIPVSGLNTKKNQILLPEEASVLEDFSFWAFPPNQIGDWAVRPGAL